MASVAVASVPHIRALTCRQFIHRAGRQDLNWLHIAGGGMGIPADEHCMGQFLC